MTNTFKLCSLVSNYENVHEQSYPYNLFSAITKLNHNFTVDDNCCEDLAKGLSFALSVFLNEQEKEMIILRYKHCLTLETIGKCYNLTKERPRQIIKKALRKLSHPSHCRFIQKGIDGYIDEVVRCKLYDEFMRGYNAGIKDCRSDNMYNEVLTISIEDANFSVRTFNCLKRAGVETIADILEFKSIDDIMSIRNLGRHGCYEISAKLHSLGIKSSAWDYVDQHF